MLFVYGRCEMMKKLVLGCCLAFGLVQGDCWGMENTELIARTKEAVSKWSHLVPSGVVKTEIDDLIPQVLESRQKMERLIALICDSSNSSKFANYAHMVFTSVFFCIDSSERNKLERMLDVVADHRGSGGGLDFTTYLMYYDSGRYNDCLPENDDDFKSSGW